MIRDCIADETNNGAEPSTCTSAIYASDGIKISQNPYAGYSPFPFTTGSINDIWASYIDEDAEYRDAAKYSKPNWIYVRITNPLNPVLPHVAGPSSGTEVLRVYWAKASTGLTWPNMWNNYFGVHPGCPNLYLGDEITKPRPNWTSLSYGDKLLFVSTYQQLDMNPIFSYLDNVSFWDKQDQMHQGTHVHGGPEFLPWHRELVNRFENLLRAVVPNMKLPYWDWTTDPRPGGADILDNSVNGFGASQGIMGAPFSTFDNGGLCNANTRGDNVTWCGGTCPELNNFTLPPREVDRALQLVAPSDLNAQNIGFPPNTFRSDINLINSGLDFPTFRVVEEDMHNYIHTYIGGSVGCQHSSFEDPFVFLLHSNVDRLFSMWQREPDPGNAFLFRLDNSTTTSAVYGNETGALQTASTLRPWDGFVTFGSPIFPWTVAGGEIFAKTYFDQSVVTPPMYDDVRLTIPVLQPGESVIMQIPWYPPNPADYSCFGINDYYHFCLLARIETDVNPPYGMSTPETFDVGYNTAMNNNIAWKNIQLYDIYPNSQMMACVIMRNMQKEHSYNKLRIKTEDSPDMSIFNYGSVELILPPPLFDLWVHGGREGENIELTADNRIRLLNENAWIGNILLQNPDEMYEVCLNFRVGALPEEDNAFHVNLEQEDDSRFVGGEQFKLRYGNEGRITKPIVQETFFHNSIYPNPNNGNMQMDYTLSGNDRGEFSIYDYAGRNVATYSLASGKNTLVINEPLLLNGVYVYRVKVNDKIIDTSKLVIIK